jgi:hypothetical protein
MRKITRKHTPISINKRLDEISTLKQSTNNRYLYQLYSNIAKIEYSAR